MAHSSQNGAQPFMAHSSQNGAQPFMAHSSQNGAQPFMAHSSQNGDDLIQYDDPMMDDVFLHEAEALQFNPVIECSRCHQRYPSYRDLNSHIRETHGKHLAQCDVCNFVYSSSFLRKHKEQAHNIFISYNCDKCEQSFYKRLDLDKHRLTHDTQCPYCLKDLTNMKEPRIRERHILSHLEEPKYPCTVPGCGRRFNLKGNLKQHMENIHGNPRQIHCPYPGCQYTTHADGNMGKHIQFTHGPHQNLICQFCDNPNKTYKDERSLKNHYRKLHSER
jgi:DNA-directed RNA polymerase subunit RPC12/RpoP